jgi:hypothetical protein
VIASGSFSIAVSMIRACRSEICPATWAAATSGNTGGNRSPVNARPEPNACAACTRWCASCGSSRNRPRKKLPGLRTNTALGNPRASTSSTNA